MSDVNLYCAACDKHATVRNKGGLCWDCVEAGSERLQQSVKTVAKQLEQSDTQLNGEYKRAEAWKDAATAAFSWGVALNGDSADPGTVEVLRRNMAAQLKKCRELEAEHDQPGILETAREFGKKNDGEPAEVKAMSGVLDVNDG